MTTALVIVSHSARLAEGVVEVAAQMAPDVELRAAGGTDDGRLGTSPARVEEVVTALLGAGPGGEVAGGAGTAGFVRAEPGAGGEVAGGARSAADATGPQAGGGAEAGGDARAEPGAGVVLLADLGSATMVAETVVELLGDDAVVVADAPLVEGAVAAAVAAQNGAGPEEVARAARQAGACWATPTGGPPRSSASVAVPGPQAGGERHREVVLGGSAGLHARPAAVLARTVARFDAQVAVDGADAGSVLALMALGRGPGETVRVTAAGPQAAEALDAVAALLADDPDHP